MLSNLILYQVCLFVAKSTISLTNKKCKRTKLIFIKYIKKCDKNYIIINHVHCKI